MSQVTHSGSAIFLFRGNSMETERTHLRPKVTRKFVLAVDRFRPGCDLAVAKLTHGFTQLIDLKSKIEIEGRISCSGYVRHGRWRREPTKYGARYAKTSGTQQSGCLIFHQPRSCSGGAKYL